MSNLLYRSEICRTVVNKLLGTTGNSRAKSVLRARFGIIHLFNHVSLMIIPCHKYCQYYGNKIYFKLIFSETK